MINIKSISALLSKDRYKATNTCKCNDGYKNGSGPGKHPATPTNSVCYSPKE